MVFNPVTASVREVLSGSKDGQSAIIARIARPPGATGWFTPDDAIWTVHGSVSTFVGGIRSLLMQALHPLAIAGVNRHSNYRLDPFGRLQRTGDFIAATTFGSVELAEQTVAAIQHMHKKVQGNLADGRHYSAQDPHLLAWVHVVLVDSMLCTYQNYGMSGPINANEYVANMAVVARAMGVPDPPTSVAELAAVIEAFRPELSGGQEPDAVKEFVLNAPLPPVLRPGYRLLCGTAQDSLPTWAANMLNHHPHRAACTMRRETTRAALFGLQKALVQSPALRAGEQRLAQ